MDATSSPSGTVPTLKAAEGYTNPTERFKALAAIYQTDPDSNTRRQAQRAMEFFNQDPETLKAAIALSANDPDPDIRQLALRPLDTLPYSKDVITFLNQVHDTDPDPNVREAARRKLSQLLLRSVGSKHVQEKFFGTQPATLWQDASAVADGRAYSRAEMLSLLPYMSSTRDEAFLKGKRRQITPEVPSLWWLIAAVGWALLMIKLFAIQSGAANTPPNNSYIATQIAAMIAPWLVAAFEVVICVMALNRYLSYFRKRAYYAHLSDAGKLLVGYVQEARSLMQAAGTSGGGRYGGGGKTYYVYVLHLDYTFKSPDGKSLSGSRKTVTRQERTPPASGAVVAVLYLDDSNFEVL
jgi:hypothetical protein